MSNVNDIFFEGLYKDIWKALIPSELTAKEVDFLVAHFGLQPGSRVLDLMCGYGRHATGLAEKGISVTAVDNLTSYTAELEQHAKEHDLPLRVVTADVVDFQAGEGYELAICMGNSINFFHAADIRKILRHTAGSLVPGGHLVLNSWTITEIASRSFKEKSWTRVGDLKVLSDALWQFQPSRIETETIIISPGGETETKQAVDYLYSLGELEQLLEESGFSLQKCYSIPGKKDFSIHDPRIYMVARRS